MLFRRNFEFASSERIQFAARRGASIRKREAELHNAERRIYGATFDVRRHAERKLKSEIGRLQRIAARLIFAHVPICSASLVSPRTFSLRCPLPAAHFRFLFVVFC